MPQPEPNFERMGNGMDDRAMSWDPTGPRDQHRPLLSSLPWSVVTGTELDPRHERQGLGRLRQLRALSTSLARLGSVADIVDLLATRIAAECGAETSVVYLLDPDAEDTLRLAAARALDGSALEPGMLCRDGGLLIARSVRGRELMLDHLRTGQGEPATVLACPLLLRDEAVGAFAYGFLGDWPLDAANFEFLMGTSALAALALDRTAATVKAREAERVSDHLTDLVGRIFGTRNGMSAPT
jgi:GAF domain-containing protein